MSDFKPKYPRNENNDHQRNDPVISKELKQLFRKGLDDVTVFERLKSKYKDKELRNKIFDAYKERLKYVVKKAKKFKQLIYDRYLAMNLTFNELIKKAKKYQKKYQLTDGEFDMFIKLSVTDKQTPLNFQNLPNTKLSKVLGYSTILSTGEKLHVKDKEMGTLNEIIELYEQTKELHAQVVLQSLTYRDCAPEALVGTFMQYRNNAYSYVHPVVAALFLPRIKFLDEHCLIANIGHIVKCKFDGKPIITQPDYELYYDLISDPNDHACSVKSPLKDLKNRYILQTTLWQSVLHLRQGNYYKDELTKFLMAIDQCRSNVYDAADLTYVKDEGAIMRRILNAFAIRPTIVSTARLNQIIGANQYGFASNPMSLTGITKITTVPMITLRLPYNIMNKTTAISLAESLDQVQWFVENKMIIPKTQQILHSRDVMFFYVGRRFQTINIARFNSPYNFTALPMTVAGWERLNDHIVNYDRTMTIMGDTYVLRSVVFVERSLRKRNLIVGSSVGIVLPRDIEAGRFDESFLLYDPQGSAHSFLADGGNKAVRNNPISYIPGETPFANEGKVESFFQRATKRGTIFMYQKKSKGANPFIQVDPSCQ